MLALVGDVTDNDIREPPPKPGEASVRALVARAGNANLYPWTPSHDRNPPIEAPAGFTFLPGDASPPGAHTLEERIAAFKAGGGRFYADVRNVNVHEKGGHFGLWENPDGWIHDLRATYRPLR